MTNEECIELAEKIGLDMIKYKTKSKSFTQVYNTCLKKYIKNPTSELSNLILTKTVHFITIKGYDIDRIKPCKLKKYKN